MIFCTLFDSNYLDKGIVLIESLEKVCSSVKIYVLALDQECYRILNDIKTKKAPDITVIDEADFIDYEKLEEEKKNRSRAEYCWTCTSHLVDYVLKKCGESVCTYIDADMYFYSNPDVLIKEMKDCTVQIVEHRFTDTIEDRISKKQSGTYCVEFNTFTSDESSLELLEWWKKRCKESCSNYSKDSKIFGDQMYLETWGEKPFVSILKNQGGGVAPWNVAQYRLIACEDDHITMTDKQKNQFDLVFYHFHNITYINDKLVDISVYQRNWGVDDKLIDAIYIPYLKKLDKTKDWLYKQYGLNIFIKKHPAFVTKDNMKAKERNEERHLFLSIYLVINSKLKKLLVEKKNLLAF